MKTALSLAAALLLAGASQAQAQSWFAPLAPEAVGATGSGSVTIQFDAAAGNLLSIVASFAGLSGNTTVAHIHCCNATAFTGTSGVAIVTPTMPGFPVGVTSGVYTRTFDLDEASSWNPAFVTSSGGTTALATTRLLAAFDAGTSYFNVHSSTFGGGEIRSFMVSTVPEPGTWALMALGLAAVGVAARRRG
jgi:hypothetical protein